MSMVSIGDLARSYLLQRHTVQTKTQLDDLAATLALGRHKDMGLRTGGNMAPLAALEGALARVGGWQSNATALAGQLGMVQTALGALDGIGHAMAATLLGAATGGQDQLVPLAFRDGAEHLDAALGILNATYAGQSLFAGTKTDTTAVIDAAPLLEALAPVVAGATTAEAVFDLVADWFARPDGFTATVYQGGPPLPGVTVGPEARLSNPVTAVDPALKSLLFGLTLAALPDSGAVNLSPEGQRTLALRAGEVLTGNAAERSFLAGRVGMVEQRLADLQARNASEENALAIARSGIVAADPYATATELEATRVQLEVLYTLTARLSGLSLLEALR